MEMFNTHRRDILNFDNYMDLKKPGFGGPKSAIELRDARGNLNDRNPKLGEYRRTVERDPAFSHPVYDPTYKAMTNDLVYKQEKKKPFNYDDRRSGIPVVEIEPVDEGRAYSSFRKFVNESMDDELEDELDPELEDELEGEYELSNWEEEDEDDYRQTATASNRTSSDLRQIEDMLRRFEGGEEFGANPFGDEESPFGEIPDWVKELENEEEEDEEFGYNPFEEEEESPFGEVPDWVKELNQSPEEGEEY